jgi:hypothetical protein
MNSASLDETICAYSRDEEGLKMTDHRSGNVATSPEIIQ